MSLTTQVTYAERFVDGDYTKKTEAELTAALAHARAVLADDSVVEPAITEAWHRLGNAVANRVDLAGLRSAHGVPMKIGGHYTWSSWQVYQSALNKAKTILDAAKSADYDIAQSDVNASRDELTAARSALIDLGAVRAVALAGPMNNVDFTNASWIPYQNALGDALDLLNRSAGEYNTTQADVDAIRVALSSAKGALVDLSALRAQALKPWNGEYTYPSYMAHSDALRAANSILDRKDDPTFHISQADVNTATADLVSAYNSLVDLSDLRAAYNSAMTLTSVNYLKHGWNVFVDARTAAATVLGLGSPTTAEVANARQDLIDAESALVHSGGLHELLQTVGWLDEAEYGAATWARFMATVAALEALAVRDLAGELITETEMFSALNDYYLAEAGLLEIVPLHAATDDFASLDANHYATVAFAELEAIAAGIGRVIADSQDPAKMGVPGDQFLLPRYWAKKDELADIRALTAVFQRIDVVTHSKHTAHSVAALRSERFAAENAVENLWVTDADIAGFILRLEALENALVSVTPLEDSLAAAAGYDGRRYTPVSWSNLIANVTAGQSLLAEAANPAAPITRDAIAAAARAITDAADKLVGGPPTITVGGSPVRDGQSIRRGAQLTITGDRLLVSSTFTAELHSTPTLLGSVTADADGTAVLKVRIPSNTPAGNHTLHVFGTAVDGTPVHHTVAITVAGAGGSNLPRTGADLTPLHAGGGLMAAGALLILIRRRHAVH